MIKVAHVISSLEIGGAQRLISDMLPVLALQGVDVSVIVNHRTCNFLEDKLEAAGVRILSLDIENHRHPLILCRLRCVLKAYDIVHVHLFPSLYFVALASLFMNGKFVYTEHSTSNRRRSHFFLRYIERIVYSRYDRLISISDGVQDSLRKWLWADVNDGRFVVINNGVDLHSFEIARKESGYPVTLLMISRFSAAKDQATIVRSISLLDERVHVIFVGDGPTRQACEQLAESLKVNDRCHFVGEQSDIPSWISKADIGIQSSLWEGFGLSVVELMAGGLPVIASDVDGLRQVVEGAGIIVECGNETALANEVIHLVKDEGYYKTVSKACKERAEVYRIEYTVEKYLDVYKELLEC